jgi:transposase InsO family protein
MTTDDESIATLQINDPDIAPIYTAFKNSPHAPDNSQYLTCSETTKAYLTQWPLLQMVNDVLYRQWIDGHRKVKWLQCVIPRCLINKVLSDAHGGMTDGHFAARKTLQQVNRRSYWLTWRSDTQRFCRQCVDCNKYHRGHAPRHGEMQQMNVGAPMERLGIDLCGPFPTSNGNRYILTSICYFTEWAEAVPIPNKEAHTVARALVEHVYTRFGTPLQQLSDQGREFDNNLMHEICRLLHVDKVRTTSYRPNTNGQVERLHRSINAMIGKMIGENQKTWTEILPLVMSAYRAAIHSATGYSANYLTLGREVNTPLDLWLQAPNAEQLNADDYVDALTERMRYAADIVRQNLQMQACTNKRYYDVKVRQQRFLRGDWVYYFVPRRRPGKCIKWQKLYDGPFLVIDVVGPVNCIIQRSPKAQPIVTHVDKLKLYLTETPVSWLETDIISPVNQNTSMADDVATGSHGPIPAVTAVQTSQTVLLEIPEQAEIDSARRPCRHRTMPPHLQTFILY